MTGNVKRAMRKMVILFSFIAIFNLSFAHESVCERKQYVIVQFESEVLDQWIVTEPVIHSVRFPNGFELGIQVSPPTEKYNSDFYPDGGIGVETVELTTLDMASESPKRLSHSYAGANSIQGPNLSKFGIEDYTLTLLRPVCVNYEAPGKGH